MTDTPVRDYLATLGGARRDLIEHLYDLARACVPAATEGRKYAMPALVVAGKGLISVMSTRHHVGIYPFSGTVVGKFAAQLAPLGITTTKGAVQVPDSAELPDEVFTAIVAARLAEMGTNAR